MPREGQVKGAADAGCGGAVWLLTGATKYVHGGRAAYSARAGDTSYPCTNQIAIPAG